MPNLTNQRQLSDDEQHLIAWRRNSSTPQARKSMPAWMNPYRARAISRREERRLRRMTAPFVGRVRPWNTERFYDDWFSSRARFRSWLRGLLYPRFRKFVVWFYQNGTPERYSDEDGHELDHRFVLFALDAALGVAWGGIILCVIGVVLGV